MNTQFGLEFLQKVNEEVTSKGQWDNGTVDNLMVADICADLRECFGTACHTDGRFIFKEENMKNWTEIKTALKMKTIESAYAAACREHGQSLRMTINEVRLYLAETFGQIRTRAELLEVIEATFN